MTKAVKGFSKLSKSEKIDWITSSYFTNNEQAKQTLKRYWNSDEKLQQLHDEFIENTLSNYYLPFAVAPNFSINNKRYTIPMVIEESSVVAAASRAAKFWQDRGGFKAEVISTTKIGHVHFEYKGDTQKLKGYFKSIRPTLLNSVKDITKNMEARGGGILDINLVDKTKALEHYFQIEITFETQDAMGANFINSCLEDIANCFKDESLGDVYFNNYRIDIIMSILSNYVPECLVRAEVCCEVEELVEDGTMSATEFANKFVKAVKIAQIEPYRAVTHNKGIMNGIDAVVIATGNDFRAVEAGVHAYASRNGGYSSLSQASIENGQFKFWMEIPLALGTVGGLTNLHPLVKFALELLQKPSAKELMQIVAVAGLAQNFAALRSLTTTGIQQGHMKMHLMNIINQFEASEGEKQKLVDHFKTHSVSYNAVSEVLNEIRVNDPDVL